MRWQTVLSITVWLGAASGLASTQLHAHLCSANTTFSDLPKSNLTGKTAIVTGGGRGGGLITLELASRGASVIIASRNLTKSNTVARRIAALTGGNVRASVLDLSSLHSVREFVARLDEAPVDLLVNNAGIAGNPQHLTADGYQLMFQINYLGPFLLTHLLLPALRLTRGRVVNVASSEQAIACQAAGWPLDCLKDFSLLPPPVLPNRNVSIIYHDGMPNEVRPVEVYGVTKTLLIHHAAELALREPAVSAFAVTPGWVNTSIIKVSSDYGKLTPSEILCMTGSRSEQYNRATQVCRAEGLPVSVQSRARCSGDRCVRSGESWAEWQLYLQARSVHPRRGSRCTWVSR